MSKEFKKIISLEEQDKIGSLSLRKVYQDKQCSIYETKTNLFKYDNDKPSLCFNSYEIFKRRFRQLYKIENKKWIKVEGVGKEIYPKSEDFGYWAWSCSCIGSVRKILKQQFNKSDQEIESILTVLPFDKDERGLN